MPINILKIIYTLKRSKSIWIRGLISFVIGLTTLLITDNGPYDERFQARSTQSIHKDILLISISPREWSHLGQELGIPDASLLKWEPQLWTHILDQLLLGKPHSLGITLAFQDFQESGEREKENLEDLEDLGNLRKIKSSSPIYWRSIERKGEEIPPPFLFSNSTNFAPSFIQKDSRKVLRHYSFPSNRRTFLEKVAQSHRPFQSEKHLINFRGKKETLQTISLKKALAISESFHRASQESSNGSSGHFKKSVESTSDLPDRPPTLKGKYILIGKSSEYDQVFTTPMGPMTQLEIFAHILDNILNERWVHKLPKIFYVLYLLIVLIGAMWIVLGSPQIVSIAFLLFLGTFTTSFSIWIFDNFYFWIPVTAPLIQILATYVLFLSYLIHMKEKSNWQLIQEKKMHDENNKLKNNFMTLISHDLKAPIAKIQIICEKVTLTDYRLTDKSQYKKDFQSIHRESAELQRYIQSILQYSQTESQDFQMYKDSIDINEMIESVVKTLELFADKKNITIRKIFDPIFLLEVDAMMIHEVILNVVENAIKYSNNGCAITISTKERRKYVDITIADNGPGMSREDAKKVFNKFYRSPSQAYKTKGTGLGLYLVKYFVQLHNGEVKISSKLTVGTKLKISLPT